MVKKAAIALAGALALALVPAANAHAAETAAGTTVISQDNAPIRTGPGWNHDLITYGNKGDTFDWECYSIGSDWTSIWLYGEYEPGSKGWIDQRTVTDWDVSWPYC